MAAFQFSVQQVSFSPDELALDSSSLDSFSSVVDPNVDFTHCETTSNKEECDGEKRNVSAFLRDEYDLSETTPHISCISDNQCFKTTGFHVNEHIGAYPMIPLAVAHYMNKNNPDLPLEAERYTKMTNCTTPSSASEDMNQVTNNCITSVSHFDSMSAATEALALQHSVIGNYGVSPVSADVVAQVVASTKWRLEQGDLKSAIPSALPNTNLINQKGENPQELIRYPSEAISSIVEKRPWFSSSSTENGVSPSPKKSPREKPVPSKTQGSSTPEPTSKSRRTNPNDIPRLHSSRSTPKRHSFVPKDMAYEITPDGSVEYETESSVSEKFEVESLCSEAFETESNFSEISGFDDEVFQLRKEHQRTKSTETRNAETSPMRSSARSSADKFTATDDDQMNFQLLRDKASLEGRLESTVKEQSDLMKERDHFSSLATAYEAQVKSLQGQLEASLVEKQSTVAVCDSRLREHRSWDSVVREYQAIVEAKNAEIGGLKEDLSESEQRNTQTRILLEETKVDMESKEGAVGGLKKKIAELHVEVQILLQGKAQLENEARNARLETETLLKSRQWFQEELHSAQETRNQLHQRLISAQSQQSTASQAAERLTTDCSRLKQELAVAQQRAIAEKEVLMKRLETIEADMKERESLYDEIERDKGSAEANLIERIRKVEEEKSQLMNLSFTVEQQEFQLRVLQEECKLKSDLLQSVEKEKAELSRQVAVLQKLTSDKDLSVQQLLQQVKDLNTRIGRLELDLRQNEDLVGTLKEEKTAADVALASANEEKRIIDESLKSVSGNLTQFKNSFKNMKMELIKQTSRAEQYLKEKLVLEETIKKNEDSTLLMRKEFEQQAQSANQNRDVLVDDLRKKKQDVESVLGVYSKDVLNYQQVVESVERQKVELTNEVEELRRGVAEKEQAVLHLSNENEEMKRLVAELESHSQTNFEKEGEPPNSEKHARSKSFLYKKLKEKIKECKLLRSQLDSITAEKELGKENETLCRDQESFQDENKFQEMEMQYNETKKSLDEKNLLLKKSESIIIELEKEKGKAIGYMDKYTLLKQRASELESKLCEKDSQFVQLTCLIEELRRQLAESEKQGSVKASDLEAEMHKQTAVVKGLRQQVFHEKRSNSHLQRDLVSLKSALEQANQVADAKRMEISALQSELSTKVQAELKHRAELEHFQTEILLQQSIAKKLNKELEEVKARDPALAEQLKAISWRLKEKTNEVIAVQEKLTLIEKRHQSEVDGLTKNMQDTETRLENIKEELDITRKEKFNYQSKVIELRKALKSKLGELEAKGILRVENKSSSEGPVIHLNIPDPDVSFDETYINELLQKSMTLSESRPLTNLQDCLNSLKQEMTQLQQKIIENDK